MLIKCTNTTREQIIHVGDATYVFNEANNFTVEVPDHNVDCPDEPSNEINYFLSPDMGGLFEEVKKAKKEITKEKAVKKEVPKKIKKRKARK